MNEPPDPVTAFIEASVSHGSLERAQAILAAHPDVASCDVHTAAILGDDAAVRRFLELDPANACVTSYWTWRRSPESVEALLRAGASVSGIENPSGYTDVDELLRRYSSRG